MANFKKAKAGRHKRNTMDNGTARLHGNGGSSYYVPPGKQRIAKAIRNRVTPDEIEG